jgi:hypothetical protein
MIMKWRTLLLILLVPLLASACIGESSEISQAKAEYIRAKTRKIVAEADRLEAEAAWLNAQRENDLALQAQRLEQEHQSWVDAEARRADLEKTSAQRLNVVAYIIAAAVAIIGLIGAASGAHRLWIKSKIELLQASEKEAHAKAQAMEEERAAHEAKAEAFRERGNLVQAEAERREKEQTLLPRMRANGKNRSQQSILARIHDQ